VLPSAGDKLHHPQSGGASAQSPRPHRRLFSAPLLVSEKRNPHRDASRHSASHRLRITPARLPMLRTVGE
jgi:hypothetical protein